MHSLHGQGKLIVRMTEFSISRLPRIEFGAGTLAKLPAIARRYGAHALLVTGTGSLKNSPFWPDVTAGLKVQGISWLHLAIPGEPSPQMVDEAVRALRTEPVDVVIGIGGGSALDAAKAIAGLLKPGNSVMDHLEGVGPELPYAPCHPVHRRADYGGHWFGSNQECGIEHAGGG